jgi:hypothetical protein
MQNAVMRFIFVVLLSLLPVSQAGAVNRCVDDKGKVTYQDSACPGAGPMDATAPFARSQNPAGLAGQSAAEENATYTIAKGAWRGPAQFQFSVSGVRDQGAQVVTPLVIELKGSGEVIGAMSDAGCTISGLTTQFAAPNMANVDVTLKNCRDSRFNARYGGYLIVNVAAKEAKLMLNAIAWAVPSAKVQQASIDAVLRR